MKSHRSAIQLSATLLLSLGIAALPGCFNDGADLKLAKAPKVKETLSDGQKIQVFDNTTNSNVDITRDALRAEISIACTSQSNVPDGCNFELSDIRDEEVCSARTQLSLAKPQSSPVTVGRYVIANVPSTDRARFALEAIAQLQHAAARLDNEIRALLDLPRGTAFTAHCNPSYLTNFVYRNIIGYSGGLYSEIYYLTTEAFDIATREMVSIEDADQVATASVPGWGSFRDHFYPAAQIPAVRLNRRGAARLLAGGVHLEDTLVDQSLCTAPKLDPDAKAALAILREAAPNPVNVANTGLSLDALLNGTGDSIKQRMGDTAGFALTAGVEQHFGLDTEAFRVAREYMRQELTVFQRSTLALPAKQLAGGRVPAYQRYAGTASEPAALDPAYYFAITRAPANLLFHQIGGDPPPLPVKGELMPLADWINAAIGNAADYVTRASAIPAENRNSNIAPFSLLVASGERSGYVDIVRNDTMYIYGIPGPLRVVQGEENMRCATTGTSEGGVCPSPVPGWQPEAGDASWRAIGLPEGTFVLAMNPMPADRFYVLRAVRNTSSPGPGDYETVVGFDLHWSQESAEHFITSAGDQGALASPSYNRISVPVVPSVQRKVRDLLAPSRKACGKNRFNCVFADVDDRIPLEDELSSDGDGVESSWKHYLNLARDAAALADNLGTDYINSGVQNSQRKEEVELRREEFSERAKDALKELLEICGVDIDLTSLVALLGEGSSCSGTNATQCAFEIENLAATHPTDANIQRIYRCVGQSTTNNVAFASLGTKPLCLWRMSPNDVCGAVPRPCIGAGAGNCPSGWSCWGGSATQTGVCKLTCTSDSGCPGSMSCIPSRDNPTQGFCEAGPGKCPVIKEDNKTCSEMFASSSGTPGIPSGAELIPTPTETLGYFDTPDDDGALLSKRRALGFLSRCEAIATTRADHVNRRELIEANNFLNPWRLAEFADRLNWEARYGGFSAIYDGNTPIWQTGSALFGVGPQTTVWPCAEMPGAVDGSVFKKHFNCMTDQGRAEANYLMLKAVLGARLLAGTTYFTLRGVPTDTEGRPQDPWIPQASQAPETVYFWNDEYPMQRNVMDPPGSNLRGPLVRYDVQGGCTGSEGPGHCRIWMRPTGDAATLDQKIGGLALFTPFGTFASGTKGKGLIGNSANSVDPVNAHQDALNYLFNPLNVQDREYWFGGRLLKDWDRGGNIGNWHLVGDHGSIVSPKNMDPTNVPSDRLVVSVDDMLNGLELMCRMSEQTAPLVDLSRPPMIKTVDDLQVAAAYVRDLGKSIRQKASTQLLANVPEAAVDALRAESSTGSYPQYSGTFGQAISNIRIGLLAIRESALQIGNELDQIAYGLSNIHSYLQQQAIQRNILDLQFQANQASQLAACASAGSGIMSLNFVSAAITCANAYTQIGFAEGIRDLQNENNDVASEVAIASFGANFATHSTNLQSYSLKSLQGLDDLDKGLVALESNAKAARRALSKALYLASYRAEEQATLTHAIGNLYTQKQQRYVRALDNAKRLAVLAKASIEQRLGTSFSSMTTDLPLVDAPATWENQVCSFSGVDYQKLASESTGAGGYADGFIGDYVNKLGNVVESYRLANNFHEGADVAVVSLKNDVMNVRKTCEVPGSNLLYFASQLNRSGTPGWVSQNCATVSGQLSPDCVSVHPLGKSPSRFLPEIEAFELMFGPSATGPNTGLTQNVQLPEGKYRFSWMTPAAEGQPSVLAGQVRGYDGTKTDVPLVVGSASSEWNRKAIEFTILSPRLVTVGFFSQSASGVPSSISVAAPMLERLPPGDGPRSLTPFNDTHESLLVEAPVCEDTTGEQFRATSWRRDCLQLCRDGFNSSCSSAQAKTFCYHEAKFDINQRDLQLGRLMNYGGFARGNFNYRIESVALNFVGTALRDCASQTVSTPCFSAGYVPYSLYHTGPFYVRNATGGDFESRIFDGKIETARGLALERYLTNPLSDTDRNLLQDYVRSELQGRPLDGNFVIRVWDQDGVDFDAIQDVQILLKYRYWTRFN